MRTHIFYLSILSAMLVSMSIQHCHYVPRRATEDSIATILAEVPDQAEGDQRKQKTLADACVSIADLIQAGAITETGEVADAFRIETANLRIGKPWLSIQRRIEMLLRKAKSVEEQEVLLRKIENRTGSQARSADKF